MIKKSPNLPETGGSFFITGSKGAARRKWGFSGNYDGQPAKMIAIIYVAF